MLFLSMVAKLIKGGVYIHDLLKIKNKDKVIAISDGEYIYEFFNAYGKVRSISMTEFGLRSMKFGVSSDNFYYVVGLNDVGKATLLKINPTDDSLEVLINGEFDIYKLDVSPNDEIVFNALSMADGKNVIGEIDATGEIKILNENLNAKGYHSAKNKLNPIVLFGLSYQTFISLKMNV